MLSNAPIALFVFKRPEHTRRMIKALCACPEFAASEVFVFCDGPQTAADAPAVDAARAAVRSLLADRAHYRESEVNRGLAVSIIAGVTGLCETFGRVIVVEDDLVVAPTFLNFLNAALDRYADDERVMQVSGHIFPVREFVARTEAMLLPFTTSWGWATWDRAWRYFDPAAKDWQKLFEDRSLRHRFNLEGAYDYAQILRQQMTSEVHSWAIRWYWSVFQRRGLVVFPPQTLVENIGFDGSGTHGGWHMRKMQSAVTEQATLPQLPEQATTYERDYHCVCVAIKSYAPSWLGLRIRAYAPSWLALRIRKVQQFCSSLF